MLPDSSTNLIIAMFRQWIISISRGATSSSFRGGDNFHEISFDDVIMLIQPWCNFFAIGHI